MPLALTLFGVSTACPQVIAIGEGGKELISDYNFIFVEPPNDAAKRKRICEYYDLATIKSWTAADKEFVKKPLKLFVERYPDLIPLIKNGVPIKLVRTAEHIAPNKEQNVHMRGSPNLRAQEHSVVISDDYIAGAKTWSLEKQYYNLTHELGHIADVDATLSLDPAWIKSEAPKLIQLHRLCESAGKAQLTDSEEENLATKCKLVSFYSGTNLCEDFAETFSYSVSQPPKKVDPAAGALALNLVHTPPSRQNALQHFVRAQNFEFDGKNDQALTELNQAIAASPKTIGFYVKRSRILTSNDANKGLRNEKAAFSDLQVATKLLVSNGVSHNDNTYRHVHELVACSLQRQKKFAAARVELSKMLQEHPQNSYLLRQMSDVAESQHEYAEALRWANKAINVDELDAQNFRQRADVYLALKDYDKAYADLTLSLYIDPSNTWALFFKGYCFHEQGNYTQAREQVMKVLALDSKDSRALKALSWADYKLERYELAIKECDHANEIDSSPMTTATKGYCLVMLKRYDEAEKCLEESIKLKLPTPEDTSDAYCYLGQAQLHLKKFDQAIAALRKAKAAAKNDAVDKNLAKALAHKSD